MREGVSERGEWMTDQNTQFVCGALTLSDWMQAKASEGTFDRHLAEERAILTSTAV
jgi:hypothetical protein